MLLQIHRERLQTRQGRNIADGDRARTLFEDVDGFESNTDENTEYM